MEEEQALAAFAAGGEAEARCAFDRLVENARPYLDAYLCRTTGLNRDQDVREDVIQDALSRAWKARAGYRNDGVAAWRGFLKTTARHCCVDRYRRRTEVTTDDTVLAETEETSDNMLAALMDALDTGTL